MPTWSWMTNFHISNAKVYQQQTVRRHSTPPISSHSTFHVNFQRFCSGCSGGFYCASKCHCESRNVCHQHQLHQHHSRERSRYRVQWFFVVTFSVCVDRRVKFCWPRPTHTQRTTHQSILRYQLTKVHIVWLLQHIAYMGAAWCSELENVPTGSFCW